MVELVGFEPLPVNGYTGIVKMLEYEHAGDYETIIRWICRVAFIGKTTVNGLQICHGEPGIPSRFNMSPQQPG